MALRVCHHTLKNPSGLNMMSVHMAVAEKKLGIDSYVTFSTDPEFALKPNDPSQIEFISQKDAMEADIHVSHSSTPKDAKGKVVHFAHGTPETNMYLSMEEQINHGSRARYLMASAIASVNHNDATVTFWPRHQYIWKSLAPHARIELVPMGQNTDFWKPVIPQYKWPGDPSIFNCENCHNIKWPLDLFLAFPEVMRETNAVLHAHYIPQNQHHLWYPIITANAVITRAFISSTIFDSTTLRDAFSAVDYYVNPVRYGDFNTIGLQAKACGCKVISYKGNPYSDFWLDEGDQRVIARQLIDIFKGNVQPRVTEKVPVMEDMAKAMIKIYETL